MICGFSALGNTSTQPPPPAPSTSSPNVNLHSDQEQEGGENRSVLLDSICNFNKSALRKLA